MRLLPGLRKGASTTCRPLPLPSAHGREEPSAGTEEPSAGLEAAAPGPVSRPHGTGGAPPPAAGEPTPQSPLGVVVHLRGLRPLGLRLAGLSRPHAPGLSPCAVSGRFLIRRHPSAFPLCARNGRAERGTERLLIKLQLPACTAPRGTQWGGGAGRRWRLLNRAGGEAEVSLGQPGSAPGARGHPGSRLLVAVPHFIPLPHAWERGGRAGGAAGGSGRPGWGGRRRRRLRARPQPGHSAAAARGALCALGPGRRARSLALRLRTGLLPLELCPQPADSPGNLYREGLLALGGPSDFLKWTLRHGDINRTQCRLIGGRHCQPAWLRL